MKEPRHRKKPARTGRPKRDEPGAPQPAQPPADDKTAAAAKSSAAPSRLAWLAPALLLAVVAAGIWYFVFRDDRDAQVSQLVAEAVQARQLFEYSKAEQLLKEAIALVPESGSLHHNLGVLYIQQGRNAEARLEFETAALLYGPEANEVRAEEYWQLAKIDFQENKWQEAQRHLELAIRNHPTKVLFHARLIDLQLAMMKNQGAADTTTVRFLALCGDTPENLTTAAEVHYRRGSYDSAIVLAQRAIDISDTVIAAHYHLANSNWKIGRFDEGLEQLEGPLERYPEAVDLWVARSHLLIGAERYDDALVAIDRALSLQPDHYKANVAQMMAFSRAERFAEALDQAARCQQLTQDPNEQQFLTGQINSIHRLRALLDAPSDAGGAGTPR